MPFSGRDFAGRPSPSVEAWHRELAAEATLRSSLGQSLKRGCISVSEVGGLLRQRANPVARPPVLQDFIPSKLYGAWLSVGRCLVATGAEAGAQHGRLEDVPGNGHKLARALRALISNRGLVANASKWAAASYARPRPADCVEQPLVEAARPGG